MVNIKCKLCGKEKKIHLHRVKESNYCSKNCSNKDHAILVSQIRTGIKLSTETKAKISKTLKGNTNAPKGEKSLNWRGGKPQCPTCGKEIEYSAQTCKKHRPEEFRLHQSNSMIGKMPKNTMGEGKFMNIQRGWFDIGDRKMFFRSKWEANYALYLNFLVKQKQILKWEYEADVFIFDAIQFGTRSYRPDFKIFNINGSVHYDEVKGYMDTKSLTKIKRMKKYHPKIVLNLIEKKDYMSIKSKVGRMLNFF